MSDYREIPATIDASMLAGPNRASRATAFGMLAIVLWGTTIPLARHLTEQLGTFTTTATVDLTAGLLGCLTFLAASRRRALRQLSSNYLLLCGSLVVLYTLLLYLALGYAPSHPMVLMVIIVNYFWPGLTLLFSLPLLGQRVHPFVLAAGLLVATGGVVLIVMGAGLPRALLPVTVYLLPLGAAALAAICWALYSNLARRWAGDTPATGMPLFLLATGICLAIIRCCVHESSHLHPITLLETGFLILFPTLLAYVMWDYAFRHGHPTLLATASYFIPMLAMLVGAWVLRQTITPGQWMACGLVIIGSLLCRWAVYPSPDNAINRVERVSPSTNIERKEA